MKAEGGGRKQDGRGSLVPRASEMRARGDASLCVLQEVSPQTGVSDRVVDYGDPAPPGGIEFIIEEGTDPTRSAMYVYSKHQNILLLAELLDRLKIKD